MAERGNAAEKQANSSIISSSDTRGLGVHDDGIGKKISINLEHQAIARGWLKNANGLGLDHERMAGIAQRNIQIALSTDDPRAAASCSRNVVAMVGQVMEQEKRSGLSEQFMERLRRAEQEAEVAKTMLAVQSQTPAPQVNVQVNIGEQFLERARTYDAIRRQLADGGAGLPVDSPQTSPKTTGVSSNNGT